MRQVFSSMRRRGEKPRSFLGSCLGSCPDSCLVSFATRRGPFFGGASFWEPPILACAAIAAHAQESYQESYNEKAREKESGKADVHAPLAGLRYGISVTDLDGTVLVAHRADERFVPASNAKLFVTAAALAVETELAALEPGLRVVSEPAESGPPTLALVGRGDPTIGFGPDCTKRCIETLAEEVAASGITEVGDIVGDDRWFADERRPLGWNWDDLKIRPRHICFGDRRQR